MHKFKYYLILALSFSSTYAQDIYTLNDTLNIDKCNPKGWCKISNSKSWIKLFRLKKIYNNTYKINAKGRTYTYTFIKDLPYNKINKLENIIFTKNDQNIQKDFKFGYIRNTVISEYNNLTKIKQKVVIPSGFVKNKQKTKQKIVQDKKTLNLQKNHIFVAKNKSHLETKIPEKKYFAKREIENNTLTTNLNKQKDISTIFQSVSLLYEDYDLNRIDNNNINHPESTSSFGIAYKLGQEKNSYRYYANIKVASGLQALISTDYLSNSNIFIGPSLGYGAIKLNSSSSYIKGILYGLQVGYRFKNLEFSLQRLKSDMKVTNNTVDYSIDDLNYFSIDYKF